MKKVLLVLFTSCCFAGFAQTFDTSFKPFITRSSRIMKEARQADDKLIYIGTFSSSSTTPISNIVRVNTNGTIDDTFVTGTGFSGSYSEPVTDILVLSNGKVLVSGSFNKYNGVSVQSIARLNADGSLDNIFINPVLNTGAWIQGLAEQADGKILIGGSFNKVNGIERINIARLNTDGSLDESFNAKVETNTSSLYGKYGIVVQPDQKIIVSGVFQKVNDLSYQNLVRLNIDGSIDNTFSVTVDAQVKEVDLMTDGRMVVSGWFSTVNGVTKNVVARLNSNGSLDNTFNPPSFGGYTVEGAVIQSDNKVIVCGNFQSPSKNLVRLNADGTLDNTFNVGTGISSVAGSGYNVTNLILSGAGNSVIVTGEFTDYNQVSRNGVAKINISNGALDTNYDLKLGKSGEVKNVYEQPDGKVIIGGDFIMINGVYSFNIARLNTNGTLDNTFTTGSGLNNIFNDFVIQNQGANAGKIVIGGAQINSYNGQAVNSILRLNTNGTLDNTFTSNTFTGNSYVYSLGKFANDNLVMSGVFTGYGGVSRNYLIGVTANGAGNSAYNTANTFTDLTRKLVVRPDEKVFVLTGNGYSKLVLLDINGNADPAFVPPTGSFTALGVQSNSKILVGGSFTELNSVATRHLVRLNDDGSVDPTFVAKKIRDEDYVQTIKQYGTDYLFLGLYYYSSSTQANAFAAVDLNGRNVPMDIDIRGTINTFEKGANCLYAAGSISQVNGEQASSLVRIIVPAVPFVVPSSLTGNATKGKIELSWTDTNTTESGFEILRSQNTNANFASIGFADKNITTFTDNTVGSEITYFYKVRAINLSGTSSFSNELQIASVFDVPAPASNLTALALSSTRVKLSWQDNATNETGYRVYRQGFLVKELPADATTFEHQNANIGTITYWVRPYNSLGESTTYQVVSVTLADVTRGTWSNKTDATVLARNSAVSFTIGTKAYVGTGRNISGNLKDFYEYDAQADTWTARADFPGSARLGAVGFAVNGIGYIGLGNDGSGSFRRDFYKYDPVSNSWTAVADFPEDFNSGQGRSGASSFVIDNYAYVGLGNTGLNNTQEFYRYDPVANKWEKKANFAGEGRIGAVAFTLNGRGYFGLGGISAKLKDLWEYNPTIDIWTQKTSFSGAARTGSSSFVSNGRAYVVAGDVGTDIFTETLVKDVYEYKSSTNSWRTIPDFTGTERSSAVAFSVNDIGYIGLGSKSSTYFSDIKAYTPGTLSIPAAPSALIITLLEDKTIKLSWTDNSSNETGFAIEGYENNNNYRDIEIVAANTTEYIYNNVNSGTTYNFRVRALSEIAPSDYVTASKQILFIPIAPSELKIDQVTSNSIKISWKDNSDNETSFGLYTSADNTTFTLSTTASANATNLTLTGLFASTTRYIKLNASNSAGASVFTDVVIGKTTGTPLTAPITLTPEIGATAVNLRWTDMSTGEEGFKIYRSDDNGGTYTGIVLTAPNVSSYLDTNLIPLKSYVYRISAYALASGETYAASNVFVTTIMINAPTNFDAMQTSLSSVRIAWSAAMSTTVQYEIHRSVEGGPFQLLATKANSTIIHFDEGLEIGKTYSYKLRTIGGIAGSDFSAVKTVKMETEFVTGLERLLSNVKHYPNPVSDKLYIQAGSENISVTIINSVGQQLAEQRISSGSVSVLNVSHLTPGVYYLKITAGKESKFEKVIIN